MLNFFRNKVLNIVFDDLDACFNFILEDKNTSGTEVNQILNTIRYFINEILHAKLTEQDAQKYFTKMKTDIASRKNLSDHRDMDYAKAYIVSAFFTCAASNQMAEAKRTGSKILNFCAQNSTLETRSAALELRGSLMRIFD